MRVESRPIQVNSAQEAENLLLQLGINQVKINEYLKDQESAQNIYDNLIAGKNEDLAIVEILLGIKLDFSTSEVIQLTYAVGFFAHRYSREVNTEEQRRKKAKENSVAKAYKKYQRRAGV